LRPCSLLPLLYVLLVAGVGGLFFDGGTLSGVDDGEKGGLLLDEGAGLVIFIAIGPRPPAVPIAWLSEIAKLKLPAFGFVLPLLPPLLLLLLDHFPINLLLDPPLHPPHHFSINPIHFIYKLQPQLIPQLKPPFSLCPHPLGPMAFLGYFNTISEALLSYMIRASLRANALVMIPLGVDL